MTHSNTNSRSGEYLALFVCFCFCLVFLFLFFSFHVCCHRVEFSLLLKSLQSQDIYIQAGFSFLDNVFASQSVLTSRMSTFCAITGKLKICP